MFHNRLQAKEVVANLKDRLESMYELQQIPSGIFNKIRHTKPLIRAVNEADIDLTGYIKPEAQCVAFVPSNGFIVYLRNQSAHEGDLTDALSNISIPASQESIFLNQEPWLYAHTIKTQHIGLYKEYPVKGDEADTKLKLAQYSGFFNGDEHSGHAYFEPAKSRIVLPERVDEDTFVSFNASLMAEKIDFTQFDDTTTVVSDYRIVTPRMAEEALIDSALNILLPHGLEIKQYIANGLPNKKYQALTRQPRSRASFKLNSNINLD